MKIDPQEEQTLKDVAGLYERIKKYTVAVRPWILYDYAKKLDINLITQFSLFKCMHLQCIFATNSMKQWNDHMEMHLKFIEVFMKENVIHKNTRDEMKKFRECPYCGWHAPNNQHFIRHMQDYHHRSIFQCSYCFYRTSEMDNIVLHHETHHAERDRDILLCGNKREFEEKDEEEQRHICDLYVTKIKCGQGKTKRKSN